MKKGSGDDPFADLEEPSEESDSSSGPERSPSGAEDSQSEAVDSSSDPGGSTVEDGAAAGSTSRASSSTKERYTERDGSGGSSNDGVTAKDAGESGGDADSSVEDATESGQSKAEADGIPWVLRRSRVKEDRENVHQFFLREEYSAREDEIIEDVAAELDMRQKDLQKLDVREAMVAAAEPEDVAAVLRDWGYEYLK